MQRMVKCDVILNPPPPPPPPPPPIAKSWLRLWSAAWPNGSERRFYDDHNRKVDG